jgi:hypothetical protein
MGINITGLDFSDKTIEFLRQWQKNYDFNIDFVQGDVIDLDFENESFNGYISLGVVEHFIEGPEKALKEAFRVLKPGGIAIISTPAPSWSKLYFRGISTVKRLAKKVLNIPVKKKVFFQYEYSHCRLKKYIKNGGFYISRFAGADWLYTFTEFGGNTGRYIKEGSIGYKISHLLENSLLSFLGAQSIVIAIKPGEKMHCFFCNSQNASFDSLKTYDVPVCPGCMKNQNAHFYLRNSAVRFHNKYLIDPPVDNTLINCTKCGRADYPDKLFERFGFDRDVCIDCLKEADFNIRLSNTSIQPVWRKRSQRDLNGTQENS